MQTATLLFPHQLVKDTSVLSQNAPVYLVEEFLFFRQYNFHRQKLVFHRATMKHYQRYLMDQGFTVHYIDASQDKNDVRVFIQYLIQQGTKTLHLLDPSDNWLEKRIVEAAKGLELIWHDSPLFINSKQELRSFFKSTKKKFFQTSFYKEQRQQRNILMEGNTPEGGKWTFDTENRKKYPKNKVPPSISFPSADKVYEEACVYVNTHFPENFGITTDQPIYPTTFEAAEQWLDQFLEIRFHEFGIYEDAIVQEAHFLNHSVLSPLINVGLLTPEAVIKKAIRYSKNNNIPINSLEGFVRQILGWREFIRGVYEVKGSQERTTNFWNHSRRIPASFYDGTTGILPIDATIQKIQKTGYAHHIERLMILGNFMLLCEFDPDDVYQWFMELFIDAYDWVMVPNVYGMSLFADGGVMSTKPYISSSNYLKKMSDYPTGDWQKTWDGLFWRFMDLNRTFLSKNPRLKMLLSTLDKMDASKRAQHFENAERFLETLDHHSLTPRQEQLL